GYANQYYAAAIKSMLQSWHNFFFVSFDPGGFVTVDKPPVGFWIQTLSAKLLGFSGFSILLPEALAGIAAVGAVYFLVRRVFGAPLRWRKRLLHLALATALLLSVSLSWAAAVDLTPAGQRPWVDSTSTNSEIDLAVGYNGLQRLLGMRQSLGGFVSNVVGTGQ